MALASCAKFAALQPARLLFSHYGPVTEVAATLDRSAEEIRVWVDETRRARAAGLDLDHAVAMVVERTKARYAAFGPEADPALAAKFDRISGGASNVGGIMHWLDKTEAQAQASVYAVLAPGSVRAGSSRSLIDRLLRGAVSWAARAPGRSFF